MQTQLSLPYEVIEKVSGRSAIRKREDIVQGGLTDWKIPFDQILIRENFNTRYDYAEIDALAESILSVGLVEPIYVDVLEDGRVFVERGHRRMKAITLIRERKQVRHLDEGTTDDFSMVRCFINNSTVTEEQRIANIYTTNMHSKALHPLEQAEVAQRLKYCLGEVKSSERIGELMGISRQSVDNLLKIAGMNDGIKHDIRHGEMSISAALNLVNNQKKLEKQAAKAEEKANITGDGPTPLPVDPLKEELEELHALEAQSEEQQQRQAELEEQFQAKEAARLERDAVLVQVGMESLEPHFGKRLAAPARRHWTEDFLSEETGEVVTIPSSEIILKQGIVINELTAQNLIDADIPEVYILREITTSASVISEPVAGAEKPRFDEDRPEIAYIQNIIKLTDKLEVMINRLDVPDGLKKDVADVVKWMQNDAIPLREWIHANKKQNKIR